MSDHQRLAELAEKHLWGHFSVLKNDVDGTRVIERGQGCHVWDTEGNRYLGFIFAGGETPAEAEGALRRAHAQLKFHIEPEAGSWKDPEEDPEI